MRPIKQLAHFGLGFALALTATPAQAQRGRGLGQPDTLTWRFLGPAVGNRIASIAGIPGDPTTYYAGAASGGIWKTTDGGDGWLPIFESQPDETEMSLSLRTMISFLARSAILMRLEILACSGAIYYIYLMP